jgi:glycosyltransferase involved in cell wall biosynthesis
MRVLHVHSGNLYGGVESFLVTLARARQFCQSMDMLVGLCFEGRLSGELRAAGVDPVILGAVRLRRPDSVRRARAALRERLDASMPDVVICHQAWPQAVFGPAVKAAGLPLVFWEHTGGTGGHWLERWARRTVPDLAVFNSRHTANVFAPFYRGVPTAWVHYPILMERPAADFDRDRVRRELGTAPGDTVIVQVSRMEPRKGQDACLQALARLRDAPGWTCWQVGGAQQPREERYLNRLREAATRLGIEDRVRFTGERADVPALLRAADVFCQPNHTPEAFGLTFVEALSAGLPVVTTAIGGALEIVDGTCGVLVPAGDVTALSDGLRRLIQDEELRLRLQQRAPGRARELCDAKRQVRRIRDLLAPLSRRAGAGDAPDPGSRVRPSA